ncbi:MAG: phage Gp37/Gp68 family protein [Ignavibacteriales bacterium]|nr:phage Gp37/Gp68 family protein [Ignavibacteriales bacterium]
MADKSLIEWTNDTWNPVTGCDKISSGCKNCYAEKMANRLQLMGQPNYKNGFELTLQPATLEIPLKWKTPRLIFVNSMSDLFHEDVPLDYILKVFRVMNQASWHVFQILTKRHERLLELSDKLPWSENIWMGVSVESQTYVKRVDYLRRTSAVTKFLSIEPLIGEINKINLEGIDWVIVGGESGPKARELKEEWVTKLRDICFEANVPFFFKQWGGTRKHKTGRELQGQFHDEMPRRFSTNDSFFGMRPSS